MVGGAVLMALLVVAAWVFSPPAQMRQYVRRSARKSGPNAPRSLLSRPRRRASSEPQFGRSLVEVAVRLRAGATVAEAWDQALAAEFPGGVSGATAGPGPHGEIGHTGHDEEEAVPAALAGLAQQLRTSGRTRRWGITRRRWRLGRRDQDALAHQVAGAMAACRVAHRVGAPMAELLHRCAQGLVEAGEAEAARRVALAGPRATARLLSWLPLAGLGLGWAWGAEPFAVLLGGGWGGLCLVAGVLLMAGGRVWVNRLVRTAEGAGQ